MPSKNPFNFENMFGSGIFDRKKEPSIKDIADHYKEVLVKRPCCQKTIKFKVKV